MQEFIDVIKVLLAMFVVTAMVWLAVYTVLTAANLLKDWRMSTCREEYGNENKAN